MQCFWTFFPSCFALSQQRLSGAGRAIVIDSSRSFLLHDCLVVVLIFLSGFTSLFFFSLDCLACDARQFHQATALVQRSTTMRFSTIVTALSGFALASAALPQLHIKGSKFFDSNGNQFYVKGEWVKISAKTLLRQSLEQFHSACALSGPTHDA